MMKVPLIITIEYINVIKYNNIQVCTSFLSMNRNAALFEMHCCASVCSLLAFG